jgi:hypothetical protein
MRSGGPGGNVANRWNRYCMHLNELDFFAHDYLLVECSGHESISQKTVRLPEQLCQARMKCSVDYKHGERVEGG